MRIVDCGLAVRARGDDRPPNEVRILVVWRRREEDKRIESQAMKICAYCGKENEDSAVHCSECATSEFKIPGQPEAAEGKEKWSFGVLSPEDLEKDLVTLLTCRTLPEADLVVNHLAAAGIEAFVPDEFAIQNAAFFLTLSSGFVKVQVSPQDFEAAKELLNALAQDLLQQ